MAASSSPIRWACIASRLICDRWDAAYPPSAAPITKPTANMPSIGHGLDGESSGKVTICRKAVSFHLFGQDLRSITTSLVWCRAER
jgi:hypothetical protein